MSPVKGKGHLAGRETSQTLAEQEELIREAGGTLDEQPEDFRREIVKEASQQGVETHDVKGELDKKEQGELLADDGVKAPTVQGEKMLVEYVRPHFSMDDDVRYCALEFSFPLTKNHKGMLPPAVESAFKFIAQGGRKSIIGIELEPQVIDIYLPSDMEDPEFEGTFQIEKAAVSVVKEIGKGASERVYRFSFHAVIGATKDVCTFATTQFGNSLWIEMKQSQGELVL